MDPAVFKLRGVIFYVRAANFSNYIFVRIGARTTPGLKPVGSVSAGECGLLWRWRHNPDAFPGFCM